jgi:hypothetical protein
MQFVVLVKYSNRVGNPYNFSHFLQRREDVELALRVNEPYDLVVVMNASSPEAVQTFFDKIEGIAEATIMNVVYNPTNDANLHSESMAVTFWSSPRRARLKAACGPVITQVPGVPASNMARVYRNFSSQAGLASFGIGGLGHLGDLAE